MVRPASAVALGVALIATASAGEPQQPTFKTSSRLVQVHAVVHDRGGTPVRNLTRDDFVLLDNNQPREIAVFSVEVKRDNTRKPPVLTGDPQGSTTISNRDERTGVPAATTIVLLDSINGGEDPWARGQITKFLKTIQPGERVAIYRLGWGRVFVLHDLSGDGRSLARVVRTYAGGAGVFGDSSMPMFRDGRVVAAEPVRGPRSDYAMQRLRVDLTLDGLEGVARHLAAIPGRKNLIWVSPAFPMTLGLVNYDLDSMESFAARCSRVADLLNDSGVVVYPVDSRGLLTDPDYSANTSTGTVQAFVAAAMTNSRDRGGAPIPAALSRRKTMGVELATTQGTMDYFADSTGGRAFYNTNDVTGAMRQAGDDTRVTYVLGMYPPESAWDGRYHRLRVKVKRAGVTVRFRRGYIALTSEPEPEDRRIDALHLAAANRLGAAALGVRVNVANNPLAVGWQDIVIVADSADVAFVNRDSRWRANLDLVIVSQRADGSNIQGQRDSIELSLLPETYERALVEGLLFPRSVFVPAGAAAVKVLVRDATSGALGSVAVPVQATGAR